MITKTQAQAFAAVRVRVSEAMVQKSIMDDPTTGQVSRDIATDKYVRITDAVMLTMERLQREGVLDEVSAQIGQHVREVSA